MSVTDQPVRASEEDLDVLLRLAAILKQRTGNELSDPADPIYLAEGSGDALIVPESLLTVITEAVEAMVQGGGVVVMPYHAQLTTQEAADYIGVSRPHLISLLDSGEIPYTRLRSHRRIRLSDLDSYRRQRLVDRLQALDDVTREMYEAGLYFMTGAQQPEE